MPTGKMHDDEIVVEPAVVRSLIAAQFPQWADLPLMPVPSAGTDNALFRLGTGMVVRLPRIAWAVDQVRKEHHWLPHFAPHLPLEIPVPLALGEAGEGYPWNWSIYRWLEGENARMERIADPTEAARQLAAFIQALHRISTDGAPPPASRPGERGVPLATRDAVTREGIASLEGMIDSEAALAVWEASLAASPWEGAPVWLHGDLQHGNLLAREGYLSAVIDFGMLALGDPAVDLLPAWNWLDARKRQEFREALKVDEATWLRGRGWALSVAVIALPYYKDTNPTLADISRYSIREVLADFRRDPLPCAVSAPG